MTTGKIILPDDHEAVPEVVRPNPLRWMRENLFSSRFNGTLTVISVIVVLMFVKGMLGFILDPSRRWDSVWTNLRLYMTQVYPESQYLRVWVALAILLALVGLSLAIWRVGGQVAASKVAATVRNGGVLVAFVALLAPSSTGIDWAPVLDSIVEQLAMTGPRLLWFVGGAGVAVVAQLARRWLEVNRSDATIHSLLVPLAVLVVVLFLLWVVPFGRYAFADRVASYEPGTIAISTKLPLTVMGIVLVAAYFVGRFLARFVPARPARGVLGVGWVLLLPALVLIVLRDPDWNIARDGGGFDFLAGTDLGLLLGFVFAGGLAIAVLANPKLGEAGRAASGLLLIFALVIWILPHDWLPTSLHWLFLIRTRLLFLALAMFAIGAPTFAGGDRRSLTRYLALWSGFVLVMVYFLAAINTPSTLVVQSKSFLGGLTLTFVLALTSIFLSFPIGVLMALGRTSTMPIFRVISTVYIEMVRGIPFITVLIFFDLILVLFLPEGLEFDSVTLAILAGTLFSGAYMAENIRGGLQSISKGQYEAGRAMGLSTVQMTVFIVMPQAIRAVIPALVGQTIAIFKDTSLVAIISLFDFLYIADKVIPSQTLAGFLGTKRENLLFVALVYWIFTFSFSRASLRLEKKLGLGER